MCGTLFLMWQSNLWHMTHLIAHYLCLLYTHKKSIGDWGHEVHVSSTLKHIHKCEFYTTKFTEKFGPTRDWANYLVELDKERSKKFSQPLILCDGWSRKVTEHSMIRSDVSESLVGLLKECHGLLRKGRSFFTNQNFLGLCSY